MRMRGSYLNLRNGCEQPIWVLKHFPEGIELSPSGIYKLVIMEEKNRPPSSEGYLHIGYFFNVIVGMGKDPKKSDYIDRYYYKPMVGFHLNNGNKYKRMFVILRMIHHFRKELKAWIEKQEALERDNS